MKNKDLLPVYDLPTNDPPTMEINQNRKGLSHWWETYHMDSQKTRTDLT